MKSIISCTFSLLLTLALYSCANAPEEALQYSDQDIARLMKVNDHLIVPGERVGPIFVGMTETQLYEKLGEPTTTVRGKDGTWINYTYDRLQLEAQVNPATHKVNVITPF